MRMEKLLHNPRTRKAHRRESWWQIYLPLILGALAVLALAVWAAVAGAQGSDIAPAADTALIFLLAPMLLFLLVPLTLLGAGIYLTIRLFNLLPPQMLRLQRFFTRLQIETQRAADRITEPALRLAGLQAAWQAIRQSLRSRR